MAKDKRHSEAYKLNSQIINSLSQHVGPADCACEPGIELKTIIARFEPKKRQLFLIGQILDRSTGGPLPGLRVYHVTGQLVKKRWTEFEIQKRLKETSTNVNGYFAMSIPLQKNSAIHFEYIGYRSLTVQVGRLIGN